MALPATSSLSFSPAAEAPAGHWREDEIASFVCHPGSGRVLTIRAAGASDGHDDILEDAGYRVGRLPITRDASHLPHAAATFLPHVIYVTLCSPIDACLEAVELLSHDARTSEVPLVALVDADTPPELIEEAYTRSGCDFFRSDATAVELLARTHLLARLASRLSDRFGDASAPARLHEPPAVGAANCDPRSFLSLHDPESGAHSRSYLHTRLEHELSRARRYGRALSVLLVDCPAAATSGPVAAHVAGRLLSLCRDADVVARASAERFAVLLPETPEDATARLVQRVHEALAQESIAATVHAVKPEDAELHNIAG